MPVTTSVQWWNWTGFAQTLVFEAVGFGCFGSIGLMLAMLTGSWIIEECSLVAAYITCWWCTGMQWHWLPFSSSAHMSQLLYLQGLSGQCFEVDPGGIVAWYCGLLGCNWLHEQCSQIWRCTHLFPAKSFSMFVVWFSLSGLSASPWSEHESLWWIAGTKHWCCHLVVGSLTIQVVVVSISWLQVLWYMWEQWQFPL